ncbi:MAG: ATP-binding protein, partial [Prosthecobacter sp.]|nr:ATP-binding protein [Prosthecobacter sp.]
KPGRYLVWHVTDTGPGIPAEVRDRIFEPFFTTKGSSGGTGLGLATVSGIVRSHGGFIQVYSGSGGGTTFSVYLPSAEWLPSTMHFDGEPDIAFSGRGEMILFLDDEIDIRSLMRDALSSLNYRVITCANGMDALKCASEKRESLAAFITDLHMACLPHRSEVLSQVLN